jgi:hypothetical protein
MLGVLAGVVLVVLNPLEQFARGRDTGRKDAITQIGHAIEIYNSSKPTRLTSTGWDTTLLNSGEIRSFPADPGGTTPAACGASGSVAASSNPNICIKTSGSDFVVFQRLESKQATSKCASNAARTWYLYSSFMGKAGIYCGTEGSIVADSALTLL